MCSQYLKPILQNPNTVGVALCARYQNFNLNGWAVEVNNLIGLLDIVSLWLVIRLRVSHKERLVRALVT
jgi:hypothetical protein